MDNYKRIISVLISPSRSLRDLLSHQQCDTETKVDILIELHAQFNSPRFRHLDFTETAFVPASCISRGWKYMHITMLIVHQRRTYPEIPTFSVRRILIWPALELIGMGKRAIIKCYLCKHLLGMQRYYDSTIQPLKMMLLSEPGQPRVARLRNGNWTAYGRTGIMRWKP
jgi:hypothetical protein